MLNDYKQMCGMNADSLLKGIDWKKGLTKSELFRRAVDVKDKDSSLFDGYVSALMYRYWNTVDKNTFLGSGAYDAYEVYNWLIDCILATINYKPWTIEGKNIYRDESGPDKCMNSMMKSARANFYQYSNAKKRKDDWQKKNSIEKLNELAGDAWQPLTENEDTIDGEIMYKSLVAREFKNKNYMGAFIIDGIVNAPVIEVCKLETDDVPYSQFNKKKLAKHLRNIDDRYCAVFANTYNMPVQEVLDAHNTVANLSSTRIYTLIRTTLERLAKDPALKVSRN